MALTKVTSTVIKDATITDADIGSTLTSAISGSTTALSSSVATRFDSRETDMTLATASIALNETNMTLATASIAAITASVSTINDNMTLATASIAAITASLGQPVNTDSNVTFGVITSGDINSSGTITATEIHTTFVSSSIAVSSGSNIFGDTTADTHQFTGSLNVSGSLFVKDGTLTVTDNVDFNGDLDVDGTTNLDALDVDGDSNFQGDITTQSKILVASSGQGIFGAGDGDTGIRWETNNVLAFDTQNAERLTINADGKVGINTTTMDAFLNINSGADNSGLHVESTDGGANLSLADNAGSVVLQGLGGALVVEVNGSAGTAGSSAAEKFRIPSVGGIAVTGDFHDSATSDESNYQISFGGDSTTAPRWGFRVSTSSNDEDLHLDRNLSGTPATCMTWDKANGNVGIGETAPDEKLHVKGGAGVTIEVESTAGNDARFMLKTSSTQYTIGANEGGRGNDTLSIDDDQANAERLRIKSDGEIDGNFNDTSDRAQKENIKDLTNTLEGVKALNPSTFNWIKEKAKGDKTKIGFIAQDVEAQFPELVDGKEGEKSISTIGLVSVLTKAVQELSEKIEHIEKTCKCMKEE